MQNAQIRKNPDLEELAAVSLSPKRVGKKQKQSVCDMLQARRAVQGHENELAELVIVCEPEQSSMMMGGLHPRGALYERPINIDKAKKEHEVFVENLRELGVRVLTVREVLAYNVEDNISARVDLEDLAFTALKYTIATGHKIDELSEEDQKWLSDEYKREVVEKMSVSQLVDTVMINPTVRLTPSGRDTGFTAYYTFEPLSNLVYTRDQSISTSKGIVMGMMNARKRQLEVKVMKFCFTKLGLPVVGEIELTEDAPVLEGGDFFPMGEHLCLLGVGRRTNMAAAKQLMDKDLLGTRRFGIVRDELDVHQDRLHLDSVFNVLSDTSCVMLETIMGEASPIKRVVDEYTKDPATNMYKLTKSGIEFSQFMQSEGYAIMPMPEGPQSPYACNFINLGESRIISVDNASARAMVKYAHFKGDVHVIDFSSICSMTGAAHCACHVISRVPRSLMPPE